MILFKSSIDEDHRIALSKETGAEWVETDSGKMEISQDFKSSWKWFVLHQIGQMLIDNPSIVSNHEDIEAFLSLLGLSGKTTVEKVLGVFPKLTSGNISVSGNVGLLKAELSADFVSNDKSKAIVPLRAVVIAAEKRLIRLCFTSRLIIGFDELEAFYSDSSKFTRDLCMVRDLLFVVDHYNQLFLETSTDVFLIAAVRSEVLFSMKSHGQEIERAVHDRGVTLSWHHHSRSIDHPLLNVIRSKLKASGVAGDDVLLKLMPKKISDRNIDQVLLDSSFFKPRDLVWRFTLIQDAFPNKDFISEQMFNSVETTYSQKMWSEIEYELSATYSAEQVAAIKMILSGFWRYFTLDQLLEHMQAQAKISINVAKFRDSKDISELLHNLYRLGAIGNDFRLDERGRRRQNRWIFRNEPDLLINKQMALNSALWRTLGAKTLHGRSV